MKKIRIFNIFLILIIFILTSCKLSGSAYEKDPILAFDSYIQIVFYNEDHNEEYNVIKNKFLELDRDSTCYSSNSTNTSISCFRLIISFSSNIKISAWRTLFH